jgi:hypothetical protein
VLVARRARLVRGDVDDQPLVHARPLLAHVARRVELHRPAMRRLLRSG